MSEIETVSKTSVTDVTTAILQFVFRFRRLASPDARWHPADCGRCISTQHARVQSYVEAGLPIHFVIPAFPAKSPNETKVVGALPDLAERLALEFLQGVCDHISALHAPGARVTICSDGHVFGDVVGVSDERVTAYRDALAEIIDRNGWPSLDLYGLSEAYGSSAGGQDDYEALRRRMVRDYSRTEAELRTRILSDPHARTQFNGIHRFMFEDQVACRPHQSRTQSRRIAKDLAHQVVLRSNAWSDLVEERFPDAIRLSIHPQPLHSEKIGMHLIRSRDSWLTPWHGVVLDDGTSVSLVRRHEAEARGAFLIWRDNRPSHFVAPQMATERMVFA